MRSWQQLKLADQMSLLGFIGRLVDGLFEPVLHPRLHLTSSSLRKGRHQQLVHVGIMSQQMIEDPFNQDRGLT